VSNTSQALIVFSPSGKRGRFPIGTPVLSAARQLGVDIDSICGGRARCGRCQVEAVEGNFAREGIVSSPDHLSEMGEDEQYCRQNGRLEAGNRLSCQAKILGDVRIDVPAGSQVHHQVVRKDYEAHDIVLDPVVRLYFTQMREPDLHSPEGDLQRLLQSLENDWGLTRLNWDIGVLRSLQAALREGKWQVTVAVRNEERIVAIWPGFRDRIYGAAVDVGSTTIAVHLCDLASGEVLASAGAMNPQIRFGEDLMSRVSYAMLNPGAIERVRIDPETLEPRFRVIGCELWSDDPGFEDELERERGGQGVTGICGSGIIEAIAGMYLAGIIRSDGVIDGAAADRNPRIRASGRTFSYLLHEGEPEISIEQGDVRAIQLAKAALYAGARLLMDRLHVDKVDRIRLAGAFGSHIDVKYAMVLGMIPDCDLEQVSSANNAAGTGARIALLNCASRREIESRVRQIEKVETAVDENFQHQFVSAMGIPHSSHANPMLSRVVRLPNPPAGDAESRGKRRRRHSRIL
jgi:uncharacterized 2Fe-2S/4Fe-4S cluster protein (DUF4445 family)